MANGRSLKTHVLQVACLGSLIFLTGCGSDHPATAPVSGVVTYKGAPVEGASVTFGRNLRDIAQGEIAIGKTDAGGRFHLTTHFGSEASAKGAVPGDYEVVVSKYVPPVGISQEQYQALVDAADKISDTGGMVPADQQPPPLVEQFPAHYSIMGKSQLKASVPAGGIQDLSFPLE